MHVFDFLLDEPSQLRYNYVLHYNTLCPNILRLILLYPASGGMGWRSDDGDHSGVVQQAGHAALDRRIGVRIPAPELSLMARPHRLEAKDAALSRQKPEFESRWGHLQNQALPHDLFSGISHGCPESVYRWLRT
jgi:hypothetical protein